MLAADGQNIRKMEANGQDNKANDAAPSASSLVFSFSSQPLLSLLSFQVCSLGNLAAAPLLTQLSSVDKIPSAGLYSLSDELPFELFVMKARMHCVSSD